MLKVKDSYFKKHDISFVSSIKKHITYSVKGSGTSLFYVEVVVGGQKIELNSLNREEVEGFRLAIVSELS